jgi:NADH dehydrogenase [ubiquinone] 1 alpha subcomplex assembly factor 1
MNSNSHKHSPVQIIDDFCNGLNHHWQVVNDDVMGGRSKSQFSYHQSGYAIFEGNISLENNGGFASVQNLKSLDLSGYEAITLDLTGDGKVYKFRFRTADNGGIHDFSYQVEFVTKSNKRENIELRFSDFQPFYRGIPVMDVPVFQPALIRKYGFLISGKQQGGFRLKIHRIIAKS